MQMVLVITDKPSLFTDDTYKSVMGKNTKLYEKHAYVCVCACVCIYMCVYSCMYVGGDCSFIPVALIQNIHTETVSITTLLG